MSESLQDALRRLQQSREYLWYASGGSGGGAPDTPGPPVPPVTTGHLLQQNGFALLQENSALILV